MGSLPLVPPGKPQHPLTYTSMSVVSCALGMVLESFECLSEKKPFRKVPEREENVSHVDTEGTVF